MFYEWGKQGTSCFVKDFDRCRSIDIQVESDALELDLLPLVYDSSLMVVFKLSVEMLIRVIIYLDL